MRSSKTITYGLSVLLALFLSYTFTAQTTVSPELKKQKTDTIKKDKLVVDTEIFGAFCFETSESNFNRNKDSFQGLDEDFFVNLMQK